MQLGRYTVSTLRPPPIHSITFSQDGKLFTVAGENGYEVWKTSPLGLVRRKVLPGTLALALILPNSPLLVLQGGGTSPLYAPNKAVIYNDKLGQAVAEIEFGETIRGIAARRGTICVALLRKVVAFEYGVGLVKGVAAKGKGKGKARESGDAGGDGFWLKKVGEWETVENELGLIALSTAPSSTLLALPGRQAGHVQLVHLPPCPPLPPSATPIATPTFRSPIILAHNHPLSTLSCTATGSHILTTSERGTLLRVWDTSRGRLEKELRRGVDRAEMWGVEFEEATTGSGNGAAKGGRVVGWSDKGTVHVWGEDESSSVSSKDGSRPATPSASNTPTLTNLLSRNLPLPKYFSSQASSAQYHLPRKNPHAFSAALGAAGVNVPSMRADEDDGGVLAERFVVTWVEVDVEAKSTTTYIEDDSNDSPGNVTIQSGKGGLYGQRNTMMGSLSMGSRDERRSFGSEGTSRTATPPLSRRVETPTPTPGSVRGRKGSILHTPRNVLTPTIGHNVPSAPSVTGHVKLRTTTTHRTASAQSSKSKGMGGTQVQTRKEKQLVAITYSGDWYRLRIPDKREEETTECELVEYRRVGVGGGGW
ncbi:hypothetical protein CI109_104850 [Kwoniella shandongensis]|uniref:Uncharacterized protein n=1 Tax=Kwoniella shandongensis TaxID=1734106 RepID=A0A5M6BRF3_9TREE|nr:uncharacterized protein CI109_006165 [Kwoniella shandongensis]KAA5525474.1 hypothetical protein CI109_006165 [Kwoniella shandongensis]